MKIADTWPAIVGDTCGQVFGKALRACNPDIPEDANVLEIGCAEFDALSVARKVWPKMTLTGIDWRGPDTDENGVRRIQGDVMAHGFEPESFDFIYSISAIEHIGLGHYREDPKAEYGDAIAIGRAWDWLKPGGWLYFDVPWNVGKAYQVVGTSHRIYDESAAEMRLIVTRPKWSGVFGKNGEDVPAPERLKGGESFYYKAYWLKKG